MGIAISFTWRSVTESVIPGAIAEQPRITAESTWPEHNKQAASTTSANVVLEQTVTAVNDNEDTAEPILIAPAFSLPENGGNIVSLEQYRGQLVVINFWAAWCPHCVEEIPMFDVFFKKYHDQGLEILAINIDDSAASIATFVAEHQVSFPVLQDDKGQAIRYYGVFALPTTFFINRDGQIVANHTGLLTEKDMEYYLADLGIEIQ